MFLLVVTKKKKTKQNKTKQNTHKNTFKPRVYFQVI